MKYLTTNEITVADKNFQRAFSIVENLMNEGYVCCLSFEEDLIIINYEWTYEPECNRNDIVFISREDLEMSDE